MGGRRGDSAQEVIIALEGVRVQEEIQTWEASEYGRGQNIGEVRAWEGVRVRKGVRAQKGSEPWEEVRAWDN